MKHKMLMISICNVNRPRLYSFRTLLYADLRHISLIFIFFSGPQFEKTGLENLEQSLYLCILWVWIFITEFS